MSELDHTLQQSLTPCITLGIQAGSQMLVVLRDFLNYWYLHLSETSGSDKYADFLKGNKGAYFRDELEFAAVAFDLHKSDVYREPVSKDERIMLQKMCRKLGVDYCLAKRPSNLDALVAKKYVDHQPLSRQEEKIVNAYLYLDKNGNPVFETEDQNGNRIPKTRDDAYLLTIAEKDLPKWDLICTHLESVGKRTLGDLTRDIKVKETVEHNLARSKAKEKEPENRKGQEKDGPMLSLYVPKTRVSEPEKDDKEHPDTIRIRVTGQDFIYIPVVFVKPDSTKKGYEITIPEHYELSVKMGGKTIIQQAKEIQHLIPVQRTTAERSK